MDPSTIRVLVVDDYAPWSRFICSKLQKYPQLRVVGEASDGLDAVQKAKKLQPDLILLDIGLPGINGIEAARRIREQVPKSKIFFVTANDSPDIAEAALHTGAGAYVIKSDAGSDLLPAVEAVLQGKRFVSPRLRQHFLVSSEDATSAAEQVENNPYLQFRGSPLIADFLASTIEASAADFGNVQLFDATNRSLRIVAHVGFKSEFLNYFDTVSCDHGCACSTAMKGQSRVTVADVATDPRFSNDSRGVLLRAQVRSVQSTPLLGPRGKLIGMVSTYYTRPGGPMPRAWKSVDDLAARFLLEINLAVRDSDHAK